MTMPNFLVIGAAKAGTTSLWYYLKQHPQIYMSPVKEPNFFAFEGEELNFCGPGDSVPNRNSITDFEAYCRQFRDIVNERVIGEASHTYLYIPKASGRIRYYIPDAKLIAILRDPVERAYSNFLHLMLAGREPLKDFVQALQEEERRIDGNWEFFWHYKKVGFYYTQLRRYFDLFGRDQIKVYLYEDLCTNPADTLQNIFRFLDVDDMFVPDIARYNVSGTPRNKFLHLLFNKLRPIRRSLEQFLPARLHGYLLPAGISLKNWNLAKTPLQPEVRRQLVREYRGDICKLQDLIQRDLSRWLKE